MVLTVVYQWTAAVKCDGITTGKAVDYSGKTVVIPMIFIVESLVIPLILQWYTTGKHWYCSGIPLETTGDTNGNNWQYQLKQMAISPNFTSIKNSTWYQHLHVNHEKYLCHFQPVEWSKHTLIIVISSRHSNLHHCT